MYSKDNIPTTFFKLIEPLLSGRIKEKIQESGVEKYVKKLFFKSFLILFIYAMFLKLSSLRSISMAVNNDDLSRVLNIESISPSQLSRRLRVMPPALLRFVYRDVLRQLQLQIAFKGGGRGLKLNIVDSTVITCAVTKYGWARFRKTKAGIKMHLKVQFQDGEVIPDIPIMTTQKRADKTQMDKLVVYDPDSIYVFDRAYVDYEQFDAYCSGPQKLLFATRLKDNAAITVLEELPTTGSITKHQIVILGSGNKVMKHKLRLIETLDSEGNVITIVTNDFQREAEEIAEIYRLRWQIEIFFRWIKQHFEIKHLYGTSPRAVENQLLIGLITYCLLLLMQYKYPSTKSLHEMTQLIITCLFEQLQSFIRKLRKPPSRKSKGRGPTPDYLSDYEEFERQVMTGQLEELLEV